MADKENSTRRNEQPVPRAGILKKTRPRTAGPAPHTLQPLSHPGTATPQTEDDGSWSGFPLKQQRPRSAHVHSLKRHDSGVPVHPTISGVSTLDGAAAPSPLHAVKDPSPIRQHLKRNAAANTQHNALAQSRFDALASLAAVDDSSSSSESEDEPPPPPPPGAPEVSGLSIGELSGTQSVSAQTLGEIDSEVSYVPSTEGRDIEDQADDEDEAATDDGVRRGHLPEMVDEDAIMARYEEMRNWYLGFGLLFVHEMVMNGTLVFPDLFEKHCGDVTKSAGDPDTVDKMVGIASKFGLMSPEEMSNAGVDVTPSEAQEFTEIAERVLSRTNISEVIINQIGMPTDDRDGLLNEDGRVTAELFSPVKAKADHASKKRKEKAADSKPATVANARASGAARKADGGNAEAEAARARAKARTAKFLATQKKKEKEEKGTAGAGDDAPARAHSAPRKRSTSAKRHTERPVKRDPPAKKAPQVAAPQGALPTTSEDPPVRALQLALEDRGLDPNEDNITPLQYSKNFMRYKVWQEDRLRVFAVIAFGYGDNWAVKEEQFEPLDAYSDRDPSFIALVSHLKSHGVTGAPLESQCFSVLNVSETHARYRWSPSATAPQQNGDKDVYRYFDLIHSSAGDGSCDDSGWEVHQVTGYYDDLEDCFELGHIHSNPSKPGTGPLGMPIQHDTSPYIEFAKLGFSLAPPR